MLEFAFSCLFSAAVGITVSAFFICIGAAVVFGVAMAITYTFPMFIPAAL